MKYSRGFVPITLSLLLLFPAANFLAGATRVDNPLYTPDRITPNPDYQMYTALVGGAVITGDPLAMNSQPLNDELPPSCPLSDNASLIPEPAAILLLLLGSIIFYHRHKKTT